ncbi:MAG: hypothetical protein C0502_05930 [Opitutus sp.]|nr:hypothetical protein [Opitutus sp.]
MKKHPRPAPARHPVSEHTHTHPPLRPTTAPEESPLLRLWALGDKCVPTPFVFWWVASPPNREDDVCHLSGLKKWDACYRVTDRFVAHVSGLDGHYPPATLHPHHNGFRLMPVSGAGGLMSPEAAEQVLESYLNVLPSKFWTAFLAELFGGSARPLRRGWVEHFRTLPWHSVRFEQPFKAGIVEPTYQLRKRGSNWVFFVGARSGDPRHEYLPL